MAPVVEVDELRDRVVDIVVELRRHRAQGAMPPIVARGVGVRAGGVAHAELAADAAVPLLADAVVLVVGALEAAVARAGVGAGGALGGHVRAAAVGALRQRAQEGAHPGDVDHLVGHREVVERHRAEGRERAARVAAEPGHGGALHPLASQYHEARRGAAVRDVGARGARHVLDAVQVLHRVRQEGGRARVEVELRGDVGDVRGGVGARLVVGHAEGAVAAARGVEDERRVPEHEDAGDDDLPARREAGVPLLVERHEGDGRQVHLREGGLQPQQVGLVQKVVADAVDRAAAEVVRDAGPGDELRGKGAPHHRRVAAAVLRGVGLQQAHGHGDRRREPQRQVGPRRRGHDHARVVALHDARHERVEVHPGPALLHSREGDAQRERAAVVGRAGGVHGDHDRGHEEGAAEAELDEARAGRGRLPPGAVERRDVGGALLVRRGKEGEVGGLRDGDAALRRPVRDGLHGREDGEVARGHKEASRNEDGVVGLAKQGEARQRHVGAGEAAPLHVDLEQGGVLPLHEPVGAVERGAVGHGRVRHVGVELAHAILLPLDGLVQVEGVLRRGARAGKGVAGAREVERARAAPEPRLVRPGALTRRVLLRARDLHRGAGPRLAAPREDARVAGGLPARELGRRQEVQLRLGHVEVGVAGRGDDGAQGVGLRDGRAHGRVVPQSFEGHHHVVGGDPLAYPGALAEVLRVERAGVGDREAVDHGAHARHREVAGGDELHLREVAREHHRVGGGRREHCQAPQPPHVVVEVRALAHDHVHHDGARVELEARGPLAQRRAAARDAGAVPEPEAVR